MNNANTNVSEHGAIAKVVQHYIDGAKSGKGDDMKPALLPQAAHVFKGRLASTLWLQKWRSK